MQFRKKPVVIEAHQLTTEVALAHLIDKGPLPFGLHSSSADWHPANRTVSRFNVLIKTLEGVMHASLNDWIIKGVKGELYPCKPDIFAATYEPVTAPEPQQSIVACQHKWDIVNTRGDTTFFRCIECKAEMSLDGEPTPTAAEPTSAPLPVMQQASMHGEPTPAAEPDGENLQASMMIDLAWCKHVNMTPSETAYKLIADGWTHSKLRARAQPAGGNFEQLESAILGLWVKWKTDGTAMKGAAFHTYCARELIAALPQMGKVPSREQFYAFIKENTFTSIDEDVEINGGTYEAFLALIGRG